MQLADGVAWRALHAADPQQASAYRRAISVSEIPSPDLSKVEKRWQRVCRRLSEHPPFPETEQEDGDGLLAHMKQEALKLLTQPDSSESDIQTTIEADGNEGRSMLSPGDLAKKHGLEGKACEALRQRLKRWRDNNPGSDERVEVTDRKPREPQYLYRLSAVRHLIREVMSSERPAK